MSGSRDSSDSASTGAVESWCNGAEGQPGYTVSCSVEPREEQGVAIQATNLEAVRPVEILLSFPSENAQIWAFADTGVPFTLDGRAVVRQAGWK